MICVTTAVSNDDDANPVTIAEMTWMIKPIIVTMMVIIHAHPLPFNNP